MFSPFVERKFPLPGTEARHPFADVWLTSAGVWLTSAEVWLTSAEVWLTSAEVRLTSAKVRLTSAKAWLTSAEAWLTSAEARFQGMELEKIAQFSYFFRICRQVSFISKRAGGKFW
jgi:hypothetical protein